jgi:RNA polymerase sigma-70 factor (ECF subfamily)
LVRDADIPIDLETVTETRLVAEALAGSQAAFERIVRRYQRPVISLIARLLGDRGDRSLAEDLAQETFVKAYLKLSAFDSSRRLSSWLFRIAHNTAIDAMRRAKVRAPAAGREPADGATPEEAPAPPSPDPLETQALGRALDAALGRLRPEHRAAIALRYEEGLPFEDVAHVLNVPESTARSYVHRARKQLAAQLTEAGWQPSKS